MQFIIYEISSLILFWYMAIFLKKEYLKMKIELKKNNSDYYSKLN